MASCRKKAPKATPEARGKNPFSIVRTGTPEDVEQMIQTLGQRDIQTIREHSSGMTLLMAAAESTRPPDVIRLLLQAGCDANARDTGGLSPLILAVQNTSGKEVAQALLEGGAKVEKCDCHHRSAIWYLMQGKQNPEVLKILLDHDMKTAPTLTDKARKKDITLLIMMLMEKNGIFCYLRTIKTSLRRSRFPVWKHYSISGSFLKFSFAFPGCP